MLEAHKPALAGEDYRRLRAMLLDGELAGLANGVKTIADAGAMVEAIDSEEAGEFLKPERLRELRDFALVKKAELLAKGEGFPAAIDFLKEAAAKYGSDAALEGSLKVFHSNRVAFLHNSFAAAFNKRDYELAWKLAAQALEEYPGNKQLAADLAAAQKAAGQ